MIKHEVIEKLGSKDRFMVTVNYMENNMMKTISFTNNFPVLDIQAAQHEAYKTIGTIFRTEMGKLEAEKDLNNSVKGLIE